MKCAALHCNTDRYNTTLHYNAILIYNTIHNTIQYSTLQYNTIFYTTLQYRHSTISTVQCNTYSALHNTTLHHRKFPHAWSCTSCAIWKRHKRGSVYAVQRAAGNVLETPSERLKVIPLEAGRNASRWAGKFWWISTMAAPRRYAPQGTHGMDPSGSGYMSRYSTPPPKIEQGFNNWNPQEPPQDRAPNLAQNLFQFLALFWTQDPPECTVFSFFVAT